MRQERLTNAKIEETLPRASRSVDDPVVWFGLDEAGHRNARNVRDLARAIRRRNFDEAELCLDLIARDDYRFREEVALGRQSA